MLIEFGAGRWGVVSVPLFLPQFNTSTAFSSGDLFPFTSQYFYLCTRFECSVLFNGYIYMLDGQPSTTLVDRDPSLMLDGSLPLRHA
jgi:hypothetical protein